ncbi:MAG TPA: YHS domain-containing protein [Nitrosarchaeum sp.]
MKDPVCGMKVDEKHDHIEHNNKKYYFCCASCRWAFEQNPDQFES